MFALGAYNVITTLFGFEKSMERIGGSGFDSSDLKISFCVDGAVSSLFLSWADV